MDIPRDIGVMVGIQPGAVYIIEKDGDKSEHYYVVLNLAPQRDFIIILVNATTQHDFEKSYVENSHLPDDTLVVIEAGESRCLKQKSTFNCNRHLPISIEKMANSIQFKRMERTRKIIEPTILERLREATRRSPRLAKKHLSLIMSVEED